MGQKVHPIGIRLGVIKRHNSNWYANPKEYADNLIQDLAVRDYIKNRFFRENSTAKDPRDRDKEARNASISRVLIERASGAVKITISSSRPGVIIGKSGENIEKMAAKVEQMIGIKPHISINEVDRPDLDATLVAESIAQQLEGRVMFRRAMKKAVQNSMRAGAKGIKVEVSGRLGGAEIARTEWYREGRVPLHTLRADIDYATARAETTYGTIGVKVWIFRGEILGGMKQVMAGVPAEENRGRRRTEGRDDRRDRRNDGERRERRGRGEGRGRGDGARTENRGE